MYRSPDKTLEVLLVHPGGPFWAKKDLGAWSIPKGETEAGEDMLGAAKREFGEELGSEAPDGVAFPLGSVTQSGGKVVYAWALEADFDTQHVKSNEFEMEWPPKSGKFARFPEVDKAAWYTLPEARQKLGRGQLPLLERLAELLGVGAE